MYLRVDGTDYTELKNLSFAPEVALTATTLPINGFSVDVVTADDITEGMYAELYDDLGNLWANYWIQKAYRTDASTVRVYAYSEISLMESVELEGIMYNNTPILDVLFGIMLRQSGASGIVTPIDYDIDPSLESITVTGYCPPQTARERLQWVCFAYGAYVKTSFNAKPEILPIRDTAQLIPANKTFFRPTVNVDRRVTEIRVTAYTFTQGTQTAAELLADDTSYIFPLPWVATEQLYTLSNPDATAADGDNPIEVDELYLVNQGNVSDLLNRLAARYFSRESVELDVIDNAEFIPGDKAIVYSRLDTLYTGYIEAASFRFGLQARAKLRLAAAQQVTGAALTVEYTYDGNVIRKEQYFLPVGYPYEISTVYVDKTKSGVRRIYRPTMNAITGTMAEAATVQVPCEVALRLKNNVLTVLSVDAVEVVTQSDIAVGVIS